MNTSPIHDKEGALRAVSSSGETHRALEEHARYLHMVGISEKDIKKQLNDIVKRVIEFEDYKFNSLNK